MATVAAPPRLLPGHGRSMLKNLMNRRSVKAKQPRQSLASAAISCSTNVKEKGRRESKGKSRGTSIEILRVLDSVEVQADEETYAHVLQECWENNRIAEGSTVHARITKTGIGFRPGLFLGNNLLTMYAKCGRLDDARQVFEKMLKRNKVSWTAMIAGYAENGFGEEALALFRRMRRAGMKPNHITFVSVVQACASVGDLEAGRQAHAWVVKSGFEDNLFLGSALVDLYCNCACLNDAIELFDGMSERDVVSWTAMISGYSQQGRWRDGFELFNQMRRVGVMPNEFTVSSIMRVCTGLADIKQGQGLHAYAIKVGFESHMYVGSALVDIYGKYGTLADARLVFDQMPGRDKVLWNAMISVYLQWGCGRQALVLLNLMRLAGLQPEEFIVSGVLNACGSEDLKRIGMHEALKIH